MDPGRRQHYRDLYEPDDDGPVATVHGNCQAEAVRVLLATSPTFPLPLARIPPVHELEPSDLPALRRLWARTEVLLSQPVRAGYRQMPLGTDEVAAACHPRLRLRRWPVVRYAGLHPYSVIVRHPSDMSLSPPVVPYHDLRTLAAVAGLARRSKPGAEVLRDLAATSAGELRAREERSTDVGVSDVLLHAGVRAAHTVNHPGNPILLTLARRLQTSLGLPADVGDPGRELLGGIDAPLEGDVLAALGLSDAPRREWLVEGCPVDDAVMVEAQTRWYGDHPQWVDAGLDRHRDRLAALGYTA